MMLIPKKWIDSVQISPKNLRLSAILISIYEIVRLKISFRFLRLSNSVFSLKLNS